MNKQEALNLFRQALDLADEQIEARMTARTGEIAITRVQHETGVARIMETFCAYKSRKVKRRILIALLAAVLAVLASCTAYANRDKIASFVEKFYDGHVGVSFGDIPEDAPTEILEVYMPSYIPEGYEIADLQSNAARVRMLWKNEQGEHINFTQNLLKGNLNGWDLEDADPKILTINGIAVYCARYENTNSYMWNDGKYAYKLTTTEGFTDEEVEKLITLTVAEEK